METNLKMPPEKSKRRQIKIEYYLETDEEKLVNLYKMYMVILNMMEISGAKVLSVTID